MSRELTTEECREYLLDHIRTMCEYWNEVEERDTLGRLQGLAFSILAALDGCSINIPQFLIIPNPHPDDKQFRQELGENWYPEPPENIEEASLPGLLHEHFYQNEEEHETEPADSDLN